MVVGQAHVKWNELAAVANRGQTSIAIKIYFRKSSNNSDAGVTLVTNARNAAPMIPGNFKAACVGRNSPSGIGIRSYFQSALGSYRMGLAAPRFCGSTRFWRYTAFTSSRYFYRPMPKYLSTRLSNSSCVLQVIWSCLRGFTQQLVGSTSHAFLPGLNHK